MNICVNYMWLNGFSVAQWLAHLEFELGVPGSIPGSRHYSIGYQPWASCLFTLPMTQFLSSNKLGYKKGVFGA